MQKRVFPSISLPFSTAAILLFVLLGQATGATRSDWTRLGADRNFAAWHQPTGDWYEAGDAMVDPNDSRRLAGKPGTGVLINGKTGRTKSLVTKKTFQDVEVHLEFMVAKGSNSGVSFHGNYEVQILDSFGVKKPTAAHCGGIYPRAEAKPTYHYIDEGSPPRVNAAKPPGQWQTLDIIFQSPRFDQAGNKTAHAKFVKVVQNGLVIQQNVDVPYANGTNWQRKQFPRGPVIFQGDYGPVALRNVRVRPWKASDEQKMNLPPSGFTALFNGKDFTGWRLSPKAKEMWSIEDGVLKAPGLLEQWGAGLATEKQYRDFVLMLDFRMPTISDSGINFRKLIPEIPGFGDMEQFNLRSKGGMGHLESYYFLPKQVAEKVGLKEEEKPHVRHIDPEVGVWHSVKLTMQGRTFSAEYDGEVLLDRFKFHDWMMNMEPAPIRLQKHIVVHGDNLGKENPCPIEYRNIFIKEIEPGTATAAEVQTDWPCWRGPRDNGSTELGTYPVRFDKGTTRWRTRLPGKGCSTPIVLNRSIYVTAPVNGNDAILSIGWSGDQQWCTTFGPETAGRHRNGSGCNASPVTDGSALFVYFKSGTLAAVELDGSVRWKTDLIDRFGKDERFWDHGTSPVLTDKYVIMARMHAGDSWLAAFDKTSGDLAWKVARNYATPLEGDQCYTTPLVIQHDGKEAIMVWGTLHLTIHDAADGKVRWSCGNFNPDSNKLWPAIATPVIVGDMAIVCYGRNDRGQPRLFGIRLNGSGDVTASNHVWRRDDISTFVPSPVAYKGRVYLVRDRGEVECIDPATGKTIWSDAFPKGRASYYASPTIAGGQLYAPREDGVVFVASVNDNRFKLLAENDMDESVIASPVPALNRIFIRGENHLFCFAAPAKTTNVQ